MNLRRSLNRIFPAPGRRSLLGRILGANLLIGGVSVVCLTAFFLFSYRAEFERQQLLRARMMAQFLARQSEVPALVGDRESVEKIAANALRGEDVLAVRIRYRGGAQDVVADRQNTPEIQSAPLSISGKSWVEAGEEIRPVQSGLFDWDEAASRRPESLGQVQLRLSLSKDQALFRRTVQQSLVGMGALLFLIVAVQFYRMRKLLH